MSDTAHASFLGLTANLGTILPLGIPMGWSGNANGERFIARRGGRFCYLDQEAYVLWATAWCGPDPTKFVDLLAKQWKRDQVSLHSDIDRLRETKLLIQMAGDWRQDWLILESLRVIPRVPLIDRDNARGYRMLLPSGKSEIYFNLIQHCIWANWDGTTSVAESVGAAAQSCGIARRTLQEVAHALVIGCFRAGTIFIDCPIITE